MKSLQKNGSGKYFCTVHNSLVSNSQGASEAKNKSGEEYPII